MTKIALITGANKGIGYETARLLAGQGVTAVVAARDEERGRAAAGRLGLPYVHLDVTDEASVTAAAKWVEAEYGRLDILVNNAGIGGGMTALQPSALTTAQVKEVYETNVFGVVTVTNAMLPLLRRSASGRIVNLSSELGSLAIAVDPATPFRSFNHLPYNSSKTALNMITVCYAKELEDTPIKVNAVSPGYCATDLNENTGVLTPEQGAAVVVRFATIDADGPTGTHVYEDGVVAW
ncbi:SDR family NAD(P)-dependent oxidoreductase [Nonomuraea maheshkhaliensis]|uniref:SDR family NAD(P)-dependent oxidoreductase n=1 Tax=Nonomuraea maheshkhaliensis TaxID=419590 RepID=A0ABN2FHY9_9ACTN